MMCWFGLRLIWIVVVSGCVLPEVGAMPSSVSTEPAREQPIRDSSDSAVGSTADADAAIEVGRAGGSMRDVAVAGTSSAGAAASAGGTGGGAATAAGSAAPAQANKCLQEPCANGLACDLDAQCKSGSCLEHCQDPGSYNSRCNSDKDCLAMLSCRSAEKGLGSCKRVLSAHCSASEECILGSCFRGACRDWQYAGGSCDADVDCHSNRCSGNVCKTDPGRFCKTNADCDEGYTCGTGSPSRAWDTT